MAKGNGKSSATSATRKKHAAAKAGTGTGAQVQGGGAPKDKPKGTTKSERKAAKNAPRKKEYIAPIKPGRAVADPLDGVAPLLPAELVVILRGLGKKAGVTRAKAVEELRGWVSRVDLERGEEGEGEGEREMMMSVWVHHLPSLLIHPLRRLRLSSGALHADLIRRLPSPSSDVYAPPLPTSVLATWCLAAHSQTTPLSAFEAYVRTMEREAVAAIGPAVYRAVLDPGGVYREVMVASTGLGAQEGLEEEEGEGVAERASRIRVGALGALGWVIRREGGGSGGLGEVEGALTDPNVWRVLDAELAWERKAGWVFLGDVQACFSPSSPSSPTPSSAETIPPVITPTVLGSAWTETDAGVQTAMWAPLLTFLKAHPDAWTLAPSAYPAFLGFVERGCGGVWPGLVVVVSTIPPAIFDASGFFEAVWKAEAEGAVRRQYRREWVQAVFEVLVLVLRRSRRGAAALQKEEGQEEGQEREAEEGEGENTMVMAQLERAFDVLSRGGVDPEVLGGVMRTVVQAKVRSTAAQEPGHATEEPEYAQEEELIPNIWELVRTEVVRAKDEHLPRLVSALGDGERVRRLEEDVVRGAIERLKASLDSAVGQNTQNQEEGGRREGEGEGKVRVDCTLFVEVLRTFGERVWGMECVQLIDDTIRTHAWRVLRHAPPSPDVLRLYFATRRDEEKVRAVWGAVCRGVVAAAATQDIEKLLDLSLHVSSAASGVLDDRLVQLFELSGGGDLQRQLDVRKRILSAPRGVLLSEEGRRRVRRVLERRFRCGVEGVLRAEVVLPAKDKDEGQGEVVLPAGDEGRAKDEAADEAAEGEEDLDSTLELLEMHGVGVLSAGCVVDVWIVAFLLGGGTGRGRGREGVRERARRVWGARHVPQASQDEREAEREEQRSVGGDEAEREREKEEQGEGVGEEEVYEELVRRLRGVVMYEGGVRTGDVLEAVSAASSSSSASAFASSSASASSAGFERGRGEGRGGGAGGRQLEWDVLPRAEDMDSLLSSSSSSSSSSSADEEEDAKAKAKAYARLMSYTLELAMQDRVGARERMGWVLRHVGYLAVGGSSSFSSSVASVSRGKGPSSSSMRGSRSKGAKRSRRRERKREREDAERVFAYLVRVENSREAREEGISGGDTKPETKTRLGGVLRFQIARVASASSSTSTSTSATTPRSAAGATPATTSPSTTTPSSTTSAACAKRDSLLLEMLLERVLRDAEREEGDAWVACARRKGCSPTLSSSILRAVARSGLEPKGMERYRNELAAELFGVGGGPTSSSSSKKAYKALRDLADVLPRADLGVGVLSQQRAVRLVKGMEGVVLADDESSSSSSSDTEEEDIESAIIAVLPALVPLLVGTEGGHWAFVGDVVESVLGRVGTDEDEGEPLPPLPPSTLTDIENALRTVILLDELAGKKNEEWSGRREGVRGLVWGVVGWLAGMAKTGTDSLGKSRSAEAGSAKTASMGSAKMGATKKASAEKGRGAVVRRLALEVLQPRGGGGGGGGRDKEKDVIGRLVWVLGVGFGRAGDEDEDEDDERGDEDDVEDDVEDAENDLGDAYADAYADDEREEEEWNAEDAEEEWEEEEDIEAIKLAYPILKRAVEAWTEDAVLEAAVGPAAATTSSSGSADASGGLADASSGLADASSGSAAAVVVEEPKQARIPDGILRALDATSPSSLSFTSSSSNHRTGRTSPFSSSTTSTPAPTRTRFSTLIAWTLLFDLFENTSLRVRAAYIEQLRDVGVFGEVFMPMVVEMLLGVGGGGAKEGGVGGWSVEEFYVQYYESSSDDEDEDDERLLHVFVAHLYFRALLHVPGLVRAWVENDGITKTQRGGITNTQRQGGSSRGAGAARSRGGAARQYDRTVREKLVSLTAARFSPGIIKTELGTGGSALEDETFKVRVVASSSSKKGAGAAKKTGTGAGAGAGGGGGEVVAKYTVDEHVLSLRVKVPAAYPLERIEVGEDPSSAVRPGVDEARWRLWKFGVQQVVWGVGGGGVWDGVRVWKRNVQGWFEGQVECAICYSIISLMDGSLPARPCRTCKNKFHGGCLYKWFHTSHSSSCPLCRSDMF